MFRTMFLTAGITMLAAAAVEALLIARFIRRPDDRAEFRGGAAVLTMIGVFVFAVGLVWP